MAAAGNLESLCTEHSGGHFDSQVSSLRNFFRLLFSSSTNKLLATRQLGKKKNPAASKVQRGGEEEDDGGIFGEGAKSSHKKKQVPRLHYMVNPFNMPQAHEREAWEQIYADVSKPLLVDVGCAKGRWIQHMAAETSVRLEAGCKTFNYCGIEIYGPLVEMANAQRDQIADTKRNLHYVHANIITSLKTLQLPNLHTICFQYCDPWLKKARRRTVTPQVAQHVSEMLPSGGQVRGLLPARLPSSLESLVCFPLSRHPFAPSLPPSPEPLARTPDS